MMPVPSRDEVQPEQKTVSSAARRVKCSATRDSRLSHVCVGLSRALEFVI